MPLTPYFPIPDTVDPLQEVANGSVFLLDEGGKVIAAHQSEPLLKTGDSFWRSLHVPREEQRELEAVLASHSPHSFLFMAGEQPAVAWCYFYARTRLIAVFLPEGDVRRCLSAPAAYADALAERHLLLSHGALARYLSQDEQLYHPTDLWLRALERPLFDLPTLERPTYREDGTPLIEASNLIDLFTWRVSSLAALLGITLDANWQGVGFSPLPYPDLAWITASLTLLFLTVKRAAAKPSVTLHATKEGIEGPVIEASFLLRDQTDTLPELLPLFEDARLKNELFALTASPQDPSRMMLRFSICRKELSTLGLKVEPQFRY